jgi:carbonic anhydrase
VYQLVSGLHQFRPEYFRSSHRLFEQAARGYKSEALIVTCFSLGVTPHSLIPTNLQDLHIHHILQNIGNIVAPYDPLAGDEPSSIETALALYPVKDIIICGHSPCCAMRHILAPDEALAMPAASAWLAHAARTRQIVEDHYQLLTGDDLLTVAAEENVLVQLENLRTIPAIAIRLDQGRLFLHGWIYSAGAVSVYDPRREQFVPQAQ